MKGEKLVECVIAGCHNKVIIDDYNQHPLCFLHSNCFDSFQPRWLRRPHEDTSDRRKHP